MQKVELIIGTSGVVVPMPRIEYPVQYQGKSRISYFSSVFNSVEINSTFYKNPKASTIMKWSAEVGAGFKFTFKLPKLVSHAKGLVYDLNQVISFLNLIESVDDKKGCILVQLPPSAHISVFTSLKRLLEDIRNHDPSWDVAVEFRNASWYVDKVYSGLAKSGVAIVIHDHPKAITPISLETPFTYIRFHGEEGRYRGSYDNATLLPYVSLAKQQLNKCRRVYCYFNNTMGNAFENGQSFRNLLFSK